MAETHLDCLRPLADAEMSRADRALHLAAAVGTGLARLVLLRVGCLDRGRGESRT
jgi:hypothetical protein